MSEGWIKIHRKLQNNPIWTNSRMPFDYRSAWIDLLLLANHRDTEVVFDYEILVVKRGQLITSTRQLAERWKWGKDRVCKYLRLLETQKMITKNSTTKRTLLTVVKYDDFQCDADTGKDTEQTQNRHESATNKNVKNEKNINKLIKNIYGEYRHVRLTDAERDRLFDEFGEQETLEAIKFLDEYMQEKPGYKTKDHNLTLRRWVFGAIKERREKEKGGKGTKSKKPIFKPENERKYDYDELVKELNG